VLRSMYSAISGMQGFAAKLDVIGNNIANVNTVGFKSSRVDFSDVLSQTISGGSKPTGTMGGTNPQQIGLGVKVAAIDTLFTQGANQSTGVNTDVMVNGSGLFVVTPDGGTTKYYTRAGNFTIDSQTNLVLPNGMVAMGVTPANYSANGNVTTLTPIKLSQLATTAGVTLSSSPDVQIGPDGSISATDSNGNRVTLGYLVLGTVPNYGGLEKVGDSLYQVSNNSGAVTYYGPGVNNTGRLSAGYLEMSNVDLTREFTEMIVAQRGFDANSKIIGTANAILQDIVNLKNS
jgi:flagellar hook protein FlgE